MITAVDTNILLDIFLPDPTHGATSLKALEQAYVQGALIICPVVYAELAPQFPNQQILDSTLKKLAIEVLPLDRFASYLAGAYWKEYRKKAKRRDRIISNFLIGAFAKIQADQFLTRDRGFYRNYFPDLKIINNHID